MLQNTLPRPGRVPPLADLCRRIHDISTLPQIALRVMEVANNPNSGSRELREVMEVDAALSARVLRCVNSSAYAMRTKVTNLQHAIAYLGVKQMRNLAMTAGVSQLFKQQQTIGTYNRAALWRHMVSVGVCARLLAMRMRIPQFEDVFLAGLLHDIGIVLEDQYVHAAFVAALESLRDHEGLRTAEQRVMTFDHTMLGESIAKAWRMPVGVIETIRNHHASQEAAELSMEVVRVVEVANFICSLKGISSVGVNIVEFPKHAIQAMSLTKEDLLVAGLDLDQELERNQMLFQI